MIGGIYTLRGLVSVPLALALLGGASNQVLPKELAFSLVSLGIGMVYLVGLVTAWASLKPSRSQAPATNAARRPGAGGGFGRDEGVQQGDEQTNGAQAEMEAPFAAHPRC